MSPLVACTIVANNYLAYARVFAESFRRQHPEARVFALIVDRRLAEVDYDAEPFTAVFAEELGVPGFANLAFRYSILELSTALKPFFLQHLHRQHGADRALYFDPDILVLGNLSDLIAQLDAHDLALTPHVTAPLDDDKVPSEQDFLLSGIYNLGFLGIAFNERTADFLDWWSRRLHKLCLHEVWRGLFVDQRWMDFAPAFVERVAIVRDPRFNVAYWNLAHRTLTRESGDWQVNGRPLGFFHFSGFDLEQPGKISKFQNRFTLVERADLQPLYTEYATRLHAADHPRLSRLPYALGRFDNGVPIPVAARRALRATDAEGSRWRDPFATAGEDTFFDWLRRPAGAAVPLPRIALALWDQRADLQGAFPQPLGADAERYLDWLNGDSGQAEFASSWLETCGRPTSSARTVRAEPPQTTTGGSRTSVLSPLALELHRARFDLQLAFPEPLGHSLPAYAAWFATYGRLEYGFSAAQIRPVRRLLPPGQNLRTRLWWAKRRLLGWGNAARHARPDLRGPKAALAAFPPRARAAANGAFGVNVVGWASAPTGVGEACRGTLAALGAAGVPHVVRDLATATVAPPAPAAYGEPGGMPYELNLQHVNADMVPHVARLLPSSLQAGRYRIGYWFWELSHFPLSFAPSFDYLDELWAPTRFCEEAYRSISPIPVRWMPPCVPAPKDVPTPRSSLSIPEDAFLFYYAFDALSVPERKNPWAVIAAFRAVVAAALRPVHLLLKVNGAQSAPHVLRRLHEESAGLPVTVLAETLSREGVNGLTAAADAVVSMHRSEGLGLLLIEAMYLGKPVVATAYGGCADFLDETTGWPVPYRLETLREPHGPYPAGAVWAEPDVAAATRSMLDVASRSPAVAARTAAARKRVTELYGIEVAAPRLERALHEIWDALCESAGKSAILDHDE